MQEDTLRSTEPSEGITSVCSSSTKPENQDASMSSTPSNTPVVSRQTEQNSNLGISEVSKEVDEFDKENFDYAFPK